MSLLGLHGRWPIALDIGAESIKMLQLQDHGGRTAVRDGRRWQAPSPDQSNTELDVKVVCEAVSEMLKKGRFRGRSVVTALPSRLLHVKNIRLPNLPPNELQKAVLWEVKERFGFDVTSEHVNFLRAGQVRQGDETREEIILFAAQPHTIEQYVSMLRELGLTPEAIDAEPVALFHSFERYLRRKADESAVTVVVDIGYAGTRVIVGRGRQIVFVKCIDIGGKRLTEAVASHLNLSLAEASELRIRNCHDESCDEEVDEQGESRPGGQSQRSSVEWTIHDAVRGEIESLAKEISLCLRYCSVTFRGLRPKQVFLTGGEAYDRALVERLNEQLGITCSVGEPLRGMDTSAADLGSDRRATLSEWAVCAGLSIRAAGMTKRAREQRNEQRRLSA